MVAGQEHPADIGSSLHARQRLAIDAVAGLWAVEYVSGHQHEAGTFASRRGRKRIDRVQPRYEQRGARLLRCASARLAELPASRVNTEERREGKESVSTCSARWGRN